MIAAVLLTDLIEFSVFDRRVKEEAGLDILGNNQSSLTSDQYEKYSKIMIEYITKQLSTDGTLWHKLLEPNSTGFDIIEFLSNPDMKHMHDKIVDLHSIDKKQKTLADALSIIKFQIWHSLSNFLKSTANLNFGFAGRNRSNIEYAVPYLAANTPSSNSEFADRWETLTKTLILLASDGCHENLARNMIPYIRKNVLKETGSYADYKSTPTYQNFINIIPEINIMELNMLNGNHVKLLHNALMGRSPAAIRLLFSYTLDEIFSSMQFTTEQITSNALNMTSMFNSVQGYSGTIDNVNILPSEVVSEAYKEHLANEVYNGGIALKLINDFKGNSVIRLKEHDLNQQNIIEIVSKVFTAFDIHRVEDGGRLSALIDTGAFFKNFTNLAVSTAILEVLQAEISVVLYYDEESNQVEFLKSSESGFVSGPISSTDPDAIFKATQTDISKRFTFYDQRHITGSDILQSKDARAVMTIGTRVLLRDILQGALRMRQFMTTQKVYLITSEAAANFYLSTQKTPEEYKDIKIADLISLGAFNEDEKQATENQNLAFTKIDSEIRGFVIGEITREIKGLSNEQYMSNVMKTWFSNSSIRNLFIKSTKESPMTWLREAEYKDSLEVLQKYSDELILAVQETIDEICKIMLQESSSNELLRKKFDDMKTNLENLIGIVKTESEPLSGRTEKGTLLSFLGDKIKEKSVCSEGGKEVEMQMELFAENEKAMELELDIVTENFSHHVEEKKYEPFKLKFLIENISPVISGITNIVSLKEVLEKVALSDISHFAKNVTITDGNFIGLTLDLVKLIDEESKGFRIFSKYTWEGSHVLVQALPEKDKGLRLIKAVLLSNNAAIDIFQSKQLSQSPYLFRGSKFWLCDLSGRITESSERASVRKNVLELIPATINLFFDILIFNGSLDHILRSHHLNNLFKLWLDDKNFQNRASFLLLRMKALADKSTRILALDDPNMKFLRRASSGDNDRRKIITESIYQKPPITSVVNHSSLIINSEQIYLYLPKIFKEIGYTIISSNFKEDQTVEFYSSAEQLIYSADDEIDTCDCSNPDKTSYGFSSESSLNSESSLINYDYLRSYSSSKSKSASSDQSSYSSDSKSSISSESKSANSDHLSSYSNSESSISSESNSASSDQSSYGPNSKSSISSEYKSASSDKLSYSSDSKSRISSKSKSPSSDKLSSSPYSSSESSLNSDPNKNGQMDRKINQISDSSHIQWSGILILGVVSVLLLVFALISRKQYNTDTEISLKIVNKF